MFFLLFSVKNSKRSKKMQTTIQRLCRTCLYTSTNVTEFISISTMDPLRKISTTSKMEMCIPEIEVEDPDSTFLCIACWNALNASYNFKCVCLATEEKLRRNMCQYEEDTKKYSDNDILYTEIDLLLDDIFMTNKTRTDLYKQAKFFLETQKVIKDYCYSKKNRTFNSALKKHKSKANILPNHITKWECRRCSKEFFDSKRYKCHILRCGKFLAICKRCSKGFYFRHVYVKHRYTCKATTKIVKQIKIDNKNAAETTVKQTCEKSKLCNNQLSVQQPKRSHKSKFKRKCPLCFKKFSDNWHLTRHLDVHFRENQKLYNTSTVRSKKHSHIRSSSQIETDSGGGVGKSENKNRTIISEAQKEQANEK